MAIRFGQIEKVDPVQRGTPFEAGIYLVEIHACKGVEGQMGDEFWVTEVKVIESDNEKIKVGGQYSHVIKLTNTKAGTAPWSEVKAFVCAALDISAGDKAVTDKIGEKICLYIIGPDKPLEGLKMRLQCTMTKTREGKDFTRHKWETADHEGSKLLREYMLENLAANAA